MESFLPPSIRSVTILLVFCFSISSFTKTEAYDAIDPNGNITINWDVMNWTPDGYVALVTIHNFQKYRHIEAPGWALKWTWAKKEVIWQMFGAKTIDQGDCSTFKHNFPQSCEKTPTVVDLSLQTPFNQQVANCCKGGVMSSWVQDPANAASSFQLSVGRAGTTNRTVMLPKNFTLKAPGPGYTCGSAKIVRPTKFATPDGRRFTQAMMTWKIICTYSQFLAHKTPMCCVSLSSYNSKIVNCPTCSCSCPKNTTMPGTSTEHQIQRTSHMCPIRVHWHVKLNYRNYWRVKITITNYNYKNYAHWNLAVQHPNFDNRTQIFGFNHKSLTPFGSTNDIAMLWGIKSYNDLLMQAGPHGNVQAELLFRKEKSTLTFKKGWAFPRRIYFNGDNCIMPPPDSYPFLPNHGIE